MSPALSSPLLFFELLPGESLEDTSTYEGILSPDPVAPVTYPAKHVAPERYDLQGERSGSMAGNK